MKRHGPPEYYELLTQMAEICNNKNQNYANEADPLSNFHECAKFGIEPWKGCIVRMSDKWARLLELTKGRPDKVGESMEDTLMDLANYCLFCIILRRENGDN